MKIKTAELSGAQLDYAVAIAMGESVIAHSPSQRRFDVRGGIHCSRDGCTFVARSSFGDTEEYSPSTDWSQCGALIQEFQISFFHPCVGGVDENGELRYCLQATVGYRRTISGENAEARHDRDYLVAACRAVVIAKLGDEVDIPGELMRDA